MCSDSWENRIKREASLGLGPTRSSLLFLFLACGSPDRCGEIEYVEGITYLNGNLYTGKCSVYKNDTIVSVQQYLNGKDHGNWVFYHPNGNCYTRDTAVYPHCHLFNSNSVGMNKKKGFSILEIFTLGLSVSGSF